MFDGRKYQVDNARRYSHWLTSPDPTRFDRERGIGLEAVDLSIIAIQLPC